MKQHQFEEALNDLAQRMGLTPIELLREAMLLHSQEQVDVDPPDEYCEEQCALAMLKSTECR